MTTNQSRRGFLAYLGLAGATAATVTISTVADAKEEGGPFEHPLEYLLAMQAIGWTPRAMFQRLDDGSIHRMGVSENASEELALKTWDKFHAIMVRAPIQRAADMPQGDWWKAVWQFLYDRGLREDVTRPKRQYRS
jgi:hypothetical protein